MRIWNTRIILNYKSARMLQININRKWRQIESLNCQYLDQTRHLASMQMSLPISKMSFSDHAIQNIFLVYLSCKYDTQQIADQKVAVYSGHTFSALGSAGMWRIFLTSSRMRSMRRVCSSRRLSHSWKEVRVEKSLEMSEQYKDKVFHSLKMVQN